MANEREQFFFGEFILDAERRELRRGSERVELQNQTFDLLHFLVRHPQQVIDKDALLEGAWGHAHLSDSAIAQAVRRARQALGDSGRRQALIRTAHGRGVEFLPSVSRRRVPDDPPPDPTVASAPTAGNDAGGRRRPSMAWSLLLIPVALIVAFVLIRQDPTAIASPEFMEARRLLIEPTRNGGAVGEEHAWLVEALPTTLDELLRGLPVLELVIAGDYPELDPLSGEQRAKAVGADWVLSTVIDRRDDRFVLDWSLTDTAAGVQDGRGTLAGPDAGLLLRQLVDRVRSATVEGGLTLEVPHTDLLADPLAIELYARAMRSVALEQRDEAVELLEAALTRQPDSALLQVALAKARFDPAAQAGAALEEYERLLEQIPDARPVARAWVAHELGTEYWFFGNTAAAETFLSKALGLLENREEPLLRGRILNSLAFVLQSRNRFSAAWETALEAEQRFREQNSAYFLSIALTNLGYLAEDFGRLQQALDFHRQALSMRESLGVAELIAASEYGLARIERHMGLLDRAEARLLANLADTAIDNRPFDRFDNLEELAEIRWRQGRFVDAEDLLRQADGIAREADDEIGLAWSEEVRGRIAVASGQVPDGLLERLASAIRTFAELGDEQEAFTAALTRVQVQQTTGLATEAGVALAELSDHPATGNPVHAIRVRITQARQAELEGRPDEAVEHLADALKHARQLGSVDQEALAALGLAELAEARGDMEALDRHLRIARRWAPQDFRTLALQERSITARPRSSP
ncbi:MAG: winged helix-turn-helix domain-containing protein [Wenzhouxiangella sp.]|jgi:DNA-binding winged helix-turn-helix (wHTH) protein/tetratricopeptide (TPR) repeat protein|nr:winged helix-turn-helix domain-containing protein [Wenzhouxiangella sp.]